MLSRASVRSPYGRSQYGCSRERPYGRSRERVFIAQLFFDSSGYRWWTKIMDTLNGSLFTSTFGVLLLAKLQAPFSPPNTMLRAAKESCCERTKKMDGLVHFERVLNIEFGGRGVFHFWSASASPGPMDHWWSCEGSCAVYFFCPPPDWKSIVRGYGRSRELLCGRSGERL